jgi:hypothetical protein
MSFKQPYENQPVPQTRIIGLKGNYVVVAQLAISLKIDCSFDDTGLVVPTRESDFLRMVVERYGAVLGFQGAGVPFETGVAL